MGHFGPSGDPVGPSAGVPVFSERNFPPRPLQNLAAYRAPQERFREGKGAEMRSRAAVATRSSDGNVCDEEYADEAAVKSSSISDARQRFRAALFHEISEFVQGW
jgi:hypothetical protein